MIATGNSQSVALTAAGKMRIREDEDAFAMQAAANYGWSHNPGVPAQTTVENYQGLARYDRFMSKEITGFLQAQARRDRFAGLDLRFQVDPGAGYYFIDDKVTKFWGELGYDFLYDVRNDAARGIVDANGNPVLDANGNQELIDKTAVVHSGRLFFGLTQVIRDGVKFDAAAEYLQSLTDSNTFRINGNMAITIAMSKRFSLSMSTLFRFDNAPLPGKQSIDTMTTAALVMNVL
jgi:putative salt-induced outer membrane protein